MSFNRRENFRIFDSRLMTEIVSENPFASSMTNLSATGLYTVKPVTSGRRGPRVIQMEIPIDEASDTIWATGEIMYEAIGSMGIGTGIRFVHMARGHYSLIKDFLEEKRREVMAQMLEEIRWRKRLAANPSPFQAPPPSTRGNTVRMYLLPDPE